MKVLTMSTYSKMVLTIQGKQPNKMTRRVGNNTTATIRENNSVAIRLHNTNVVILRNDGTVTLNSGGWKTATTKARMNQYLNNHTVFQNKGEWFVWNRADNTSEEFFDGMTFND